MAAKRKTKSSPSLSVILQQVITVALGVINTAITSVTKDKLIIGRELYTLFLTVPWKSTTYNSFAQFCKKEIDLDSTTINRAMYLARKQREYGYTSKQMDTLSNHFSFSTLPRVFKLLNGKKLSVTAIIKKYKGKINSITTVQTSKNGKVARVVMTNMFTFILDDKHSKILEQLLEDNGMTKTPKGMKLNSSAAMATFLDTY